MLVLGIETSCDETAAAVVGDAEAPTGRIRASVVLSQIAEHKPYEGVVPEIAARAHVEALDTIIAIKPRLGSGESANKCLSDPALSEARKAMPLQPKNARSRAVIGI